MLKISTFTTAILLALIGQTAWAATLMPFINEIHYDNRGKDINEGIELAGPAGFDLSGWSLVLYNGGNGKAYNTRTLEGSLPSQANGYGVLALDYSKPGMQNGPDGVALVSPDNNIVQFISYEGVFSASNGPAEGLSSVDIGFDESGATEPGWSLQLTGNGRNAADFNWQAATTHSFGAINAGQSFTSSAQQPVPLPAALPLLLSAGAGLGLFVRRRTG